MANEGQYPKVDGDVLYASEINSPFKSDFQAFPISGRGLSGTNPTTITTLNIISGTVFSLYGNMPYTISGGFVGSIYGEAIYTDGTSGIKIFQAINIGGNLENGGAGYSFNPINGKLIQQFFIKTQVSTGSLFFPGNSNQVNFLIYHYTSGTGD